MEDVAYDLERRPGEFAARRASRQSTIVWAIAGVLLVLAFVAVVLAVSGRATVLTSVLVIVAALALRRVGFKRVDTAVRWLTGARAEISVGEELDLLKHEGYDVWHDLDHLVGGNIDHVIAGPTGVYMVETKARAYLESHLPRAKRHAKVVSDRLGGVWVTPVICIHRPTAEPFETQGVWIVPKHCINDWIRAQRNRTVDPAVLLEGLSS
jgi:hypothetical protein